MVMTEHGQAMFSRQIARNINQIQKLAEGIPILQIWQQFVSIL